MGKNKQFNIKIILQKVKRPSKVLVTAGMPYANGMLHIGHLAGAQLPADIYARWYGLLIGRENVKFVSGNDDHGSTSEIAAKQAGKSIRDFIDEIHDAQSRTMEKYSINMDVFSGTSQPDCFKYHKELCKDFINKLYKNGLLEKKTTAQWYDPKIKRFLPDRYVRGRCPNPKCKNPDAYSDECDVCGKQHEPSNLKNPRSTLSDGIPEMRDTTHWWLNMWSVSEIIREWILEKQKKKKWRKSTINQVLEYVMPSLAFENTYEQKYKSFKSELPKHKMKYAPGKKVVLQFENKKNMEKSFEILKKYDLAFQINNNWAERSITRDISWGIPLPDIDPELRGKSLYVWPDSLIAPIAFTKLCLEQNGENPEKYKEYWCDSESRIVQFLGQDNVFFYVLMQAALWLGTQDDIHRMPEKGEYQLSDIVGNFHLMVNGEKMSKSRGNFYTGDQLLDEMGYSSDQIRYYMAILGLSSHESDFDFEKLNERNKFLAGPMNAAFERPISACHSKFNGIVPEGVLIEDIEKKTTRIVARYMKAMEKADYPNLLYEIESYARIINTLFNKYKPHDDREDEAGRKNALYSAFYVLKSLMIMLYPFVPTTAASLRESLNLDEKTLSLDQLGTAIRPGHRINQQQEYFPTVLEF